MSIPPKITINGAEMTVSKASRTYTGIGRVCLLAAIEMRADWTLEELSRLRSQRDAGMAKILRANARAFDRNSIAFKDIGA